MEKNCLYTCAYMYVYMYSYLVSISCVVMADSTLIFIVFVPSCAPESVSFSPSSSVRFYLLAFSKSESWWLV